MIWKITQSKNWESLKKEFPWIEKSSNSINDICSKDEEDIVIDTYTFLDTLTKSPQYISLLEQEKEILWAAGLLLNMIEKKAPSQREGYTNVSANKYARRRERAGRVILYRDIPTPFAIRETVVALLRFHGLPLWIMEKLEPAKKIHSISQRVDTRYLKILAEADAQSRKGKVIQPLLDSLDLFEKFCKDEGCWGKSLSFESPNARYEYFNTIDGYTGHDTKKEFKTSVIILCGLPGMGKSSYSKRYYKGLPVISLKEIKYNDKYSTTDKTTTSKVLQEAKKQAREYLRKGDAFVWNESNITSLKRHKLVDFFTLYGAKVKIVYLEKPYHTWREQNSNTDQPFPKDILDKMVEKLEIPQLIEAHEIEYVVS